MTDAPRISPRREAVAKWLVQFDARRILQGLQGAQRSPAAPGGDRLYLAEADDLLSLLGAAEQDSQRLDAERYRWLKAMAPEAICAIAWRVKAACNFGKPDEAIDAARGASGQPQ